MVGVALAVMAGTEAADAAAGQARGRLAVSVRVIDRCKTTSTDNAVTQVCSGRVPLAVKAEPPPPRRVVSGASARPRDGVAPTVTADTTYVTVIY